jgi:hypothetical protein
VAVWGFVNGVAGVFSREVTGFPPGGVVTSGCTTGFSEHPDTITNAITRPVTRENTVLLFNPASLPYYSDEFYGTAGKYSFSVPPDALMKTRRSPVATGRSFGQPGGGHPSITGFLKTGYTGRDTGEGDR